MPRSDSDSRSALSVGMTWASRVTSIGLEFVVPILLGYWLDGKAGSTPAATLVGLLVGLFVGMTHLLQIARESQARTR